MSTGRNHQARRLSSLLQRATGSDDVLVVWNRTRRRYVVRWNLGPTEEQMRTALAQAAPEVPLLDPSTFGFDRREIKYLPHQRVGSIHPAVSPPIAPAAR